jgi:hypothetical protein
MYQPENWIRLFDDPAKGKIVLPLPYGQFSSSDTSSIYLSDGTSDLKNTLNRVLVHIRALFAVDHRA